MANIYCTLTEYTCSPWDMYEYARQVSGYAPSRKIGAIGWADMKVTLRKSGFDCTLNTKPESYEQFQQDFNSGNYTIGGAEAAKYAQAITAKITVPMQYKTKRSEIDISDASDFLRRMPGVTKVSNPIEITKETLPEYESVYVFADDNF